MKYQIHPRPVILAALILAAGMYRLFMASETLSPLANFTPLGAMALFGGCYYQDKWKAYFVPLFTLWLTDIILNRLIFFHEWEFFYDGFLWVYGSFALMVLIGGHIRKASVKSILFASLAGAITHWLITDFGVWLGSGTDITTGLPYTRDWQGFWKCLYLALPFMRNLLIGNLMYGALLFGCFEFMQHRFPSLRLRPAYQ